jgi:ubiquinone/menaquinone biosynthesis C-methylase UbiE
MELRRKITERYYRWLDRADGIMAELDRFYRAELDLRPSDRVLDLGGGTGYWTRRVLKDRAGQVVIADSFDPEHRHYAKDAIALHQSESKVSLLRADGGRLPIADGAFDKVLCTQVIEHVDDPESLIREIGRVLKPGGVAVLDTPDGDFLAGYDFPITRRRLASIARSGVAPAVDNDEYLKSGGYEGWEKRIGHRRRMTKDELTAAGARHGLRVIKVAWFHKALLGAPMWEMKMCHPRTFARYLAPLSRIPYRLEQLLFSGQLGLDIAVVYQRA